MKEFLIVTLVIFITLLPLALISRRLYRWLRRDNLVAELTEETIRLSDLAGGLRKVAAEKEDFQHLYSCALDNWETARRRIDELESSSRTDHQTIGDLHQQLAALKRQLASAKGQVSRLKKLAGVPVKAPARKRGGK